jgi:hypothetical protein
VNRIKRPQADRVKGKLLRVPFKGNELQHFLDFCDGNEQTQGGFARLAILEKLDREEKRKAVSA